MEQARKHLKFSSLAILTLAGLSLINIASELLSILIEVAFLYDYVKYARVVAKAN